MWYRIREVPLVCNSTQQRRRPLREQVNDTLLQVWRTCKLNSGLKLQVRQLQLSKGSLARHTKMPERSTYQNMWRWADLKEQGRQDRKTKRDSCCRSSSAPRAAPVRGRRGAGNGSAMLTLEPGAYEWAEAVVPREKASPFPSCSRPPVEVAGKLNTIQQIWQPLLEGGQSQGQNLPP